jgi:O-antigen/teichoic acid export membrane protein
MTQQHQNVGRRMAVGAAWMVGLRMARRVLGVISTIILARLLVPADFGIVVIATSAVAAFDFMSKFNFDLALISNQDVTREHYDTAWTMAIMRGLAITFVTIAIAPYAADFFEEPHLRDALYVISIAVFLEGLVSIKVIDFFRDLDLSKNFQMTVTSSLVALVVKVSLALWWHSYWAMIAGIVAESFVLLILSYYLAPYIPRLCLTKWREIFNFSKWLLVSNFGEFLSTRLDKFVLKRYLDSSVLGVYTVAFEISNLPTTNLVMPIQGALFPGYAKIAHDRQALVRNYLASMSLIVMLAVPAGLGIALAADSIVRVMLGEKWLASIPLLEILAIYGVIRIASANTRPLMLALSRPDMVMYLTMLQLGTLVPLLWWGAATLGAPGAAWALVGSSTVAGVASLTVVLRWLRIGPGAFLSAVWRTLLASALMAVAIWLVKPWLPSIDTFVSALLRLLAIVGCGAVVYVVAHLALWVAARRPEGGESAILHAFAGKSPVLRRVFVGLGLL